MSVSEMIEAKRQQALERKRASQERRLETAATQTSSTPSYGPIVLKRRNSSPEASPQPQKRTKATSAEPTLPPAQPSQNGNINSYKPGDKIVVFTDGACPGNGTDAAFAGIGVYFGDNDPRNISEALEGRQTNQRAELMAAIRCLESIMANHGQVPVELRTDSIYVVKGITEWIINWKRKGWNNNTVVNRDLWERLDAIRNAFQRIDWVHVAGHAGIKGNEEADKLAVAGAALQQQALAAAEKPPNT